jgi:hypothetical protein
MKTVYSGIGGRDMKYQVDSTCYSDDVKLFRPSVGCLEVDL